MKNEDFLSFVFKKFLSACHFQLSTSAPGYASESYEIVRYDDTDKSLVADKKRFFVNQWNEGEIGLYRDRMEIRLGGREWIIEPLAEKIDIFKILELS